MANISYDYDTAAIRREARKIQRCCDQIEDRALPRIKSAKSHLEDEFVGRAATALDNSLNQTQKKLSTLENDLRSLYTALMRYADALDRADAELAERFSGR